MSEHSDLFAALKPWLFAGATVTVGALARWSAELRSGRKGTLRRIVYDIPSLGALTVLGLYVANILRADENTTGVICVTIGYAGPAALNLLVSRWLPRLLGASAVDRTPLP